MPFIHCLQHWHYWQCRKPCSNFQLLKKVSSAGSSIAYPHKQGWGPLSYYILQSLGFTWPYIVKYWGFFVCHNINFIFVFSNTNKFATQTVHTDNAPVKSKEGAWLAHQTFKDDQPLTSHTDPTAKRLMKSVATSDYEKNPHLIT